MPTTTTTKLPKFSVHYSGGAGPKKNPSTERGKLELRADTDTRPKVLVYSNDVDEIAAIAKKLGVDVAKAS